MLCFEEELGISNALFGRQLFGISTVWCFFLVWVLGKKWSDFIGIAAILLRVIIRLFVCGADMG